MRLRRSLFFVAPATPAGRPSRRQPRRDRQGPPRPTRLGRLRSARRPQAAPGCRARGAFVLSQRMARHCPAPQLPQIKCTNQGFPSRRPFAASHSRPRDAPRDTNHGLYGRSVGRWCARVAQPKTAARTAAPAAQSMLPCSLLPTIARNCPAPFYCLPAHDCAQLCSMGGSLVAPEQVSAHRPPFSVGLTTSAVRRSSRRPPACSAVANAK